MLKNSHVLYCKASFDNLIISAYYVLKNMRGVTLLAETNICEPGKSTGTFAHRLQR